MSGPRGFVLADGRLYPTPVWHGVLCEAVMQIIEERCPAAATPRTMARLLRGIKTEETLFEAHRRACDILSATGIGVLPDEMDGAFRIEAVFPVDNAVPLR